MITLILRSIIVYCIVLFAVRLMGKRQIGDMQPFELVVTLIIADLACVPISDVSIPIVFGIVPLFTLVVFHFFFTLLNRKFIWFRKLVNGKPVIIMDNNGINYSALKKLNMTLNDLNEGLRANGCFNIGDVAFAIVETNGAINVLLKPSASPVSASNLNIELPNESLPIMLINDGKIVEENMKLLGYNKDFIEKTLKKEKVKDISNVLILTIDESKEVFFQEKNKKCKIFKIGEKK